MKPSRDRRTNAAVTDSSTSDPPPFTKEQFEILHKLFGQNTSASDSSIIGTGTAAHWGDVHFALLSQNDLSTSWIVDSGASDQMTGNFGFFESNSLFRESKSVRIVLGSGSIGLSPDLCLHNVVIVPGLRWNLLYVSKLTHDLQCYATFGSAELCSDLYLLQFKNFSKTQPSSPSGLSSLQVSSDFHSNKDSESLLWHYHLGHSNFVYIQKLFPLLFSNKYSHYCDICQLSKHAQHSFTPYRISLPNFFPHPQRYMGAFTSETLRTLIGFYRL